MTQYHYNQLSDIEKAITDDLTKDWYINGEFSNVTDIVSMMEFAHESVTSATQIKLGAVEYNWEHVAQAIVYRFGYALENSEKREAK